MNITKFTILTIIVVLIGYSHTAAAEVIPTNWFSNQTNSQNVIDPPFLERPLERLRLQDGFNAGFIEGVVSLPFVDTWQINTHISTDGNFDLPTEFVEVRIDGVLVGTFFNTPLDTTYSFLHSITGDSFSYRFDFSSPSTDEGAHLIVTAGFITSSSIPEQLMKQLYSVDVNTDELVQINSVTGAVSVIGSLGMDAHDIDLTLTSNGQLFGLNTALTSGVDLWTIDRTTGAVDTTTKVTGIIFAEGLGHSGNNLNIGYSSGSNYTFSDRFADLSTTGEISNSMSFTVSNTGHLLDFDALSVGLGDIPFYAADGRHPPSSNETKLLTVNPDAPIATAIGTYNFNEVATNDLIALGSNIFGIDHINSVLHRIDPITGSVDETISLDRNGYYFGLAASIPPPRPNICSLDVDGNGVFDALTDGIVIIRFAFGFRGDTLIYGKSPVDPANDCSKGFLDREPNKDCPDAIDAENCTRCTSEEIEACMEKIAP